MAHTQVQPLRKTVQNRARCTNTHTHTHTHTHTRNPRPKHSCDITNGKSTVVKVSEQDGCGRQPTLNCNVLKAPEAVATSHVHVLSCNGFTHQLISDWKRLVFSFRGNSSPHLVSLKLQARGQGLKFLAPCRCQPGVSQDVLAFLTLVRVPDPKPPPVEELFAL